jgi:hypothetical protein
MPGGAGNCAARFFYGGAVRRSVLVILFAPWVRDKNK